MGSRAGLALLLALAMVGAGCVGGSLEKGTGDPEDGSSDTRPATPDVNISHVEETFAFSFHQARAPGVGPRVTGENCLFLHDAGPELTLHNATLRATWETTGGDSELLLQVFRRDRFTPRAEARGAGAVEVELDGWKPYYPNGTVDAIMRLWVPETVDASVDVQGHFEVDWTFSGTLGGLSPGTCT